MYLVGGSEGSLLFNTSYQITGYEPGVNSINHFFYSIDYYRKAIMKRLSSLSFILFVYRYLQLHEQYREKLILPLFETRASRKTPRRLSSNTTGKTPRYITMSIFKTAPAPPQFGKLYVLKKPRSHSPGESRSIRYCDRHRDIPPNWRQRIGHSSKARRLSQMSGHRTLSHPSSMHPHCDDAHQPSP